MNKPCTSQDSEQRNAAERKRRSRQYNHEANKKPKNEIQTAEQRRLNNKVTTTQARQNESIDQADQRRSKDNERYAQSRQNESIDQADQRRSKDNERYAQSRQNESIDQADQRRSKDNERYAQSRQNESIDQADQRRSKDNERYAQSRQNESIDQADQRRRNRNQRLAQSRRRQRITIFKARQISDVLIGVQLVEYLNIGTLFNANGEPSEKPCQFCYAVKFKGETTGMCCASGQVQLTAFPPHPPVIAKLYEDNSNDGNCFRKYLRQLNNALALASLKATEPKMPGGGWQPSVIIQGKVFIRIGPLQITNDLPPAFSQIYVLDPDHASAETEIRFNHMRLPNTVSENEKTTLKNLLRILQTELRHCNRYVKDFKHAYELITEQNTENLNLILNENKRPETHHARRYNEGFQEISVVYNDVQPEKRAYVLTKRGEGNHTSEIQDTHRSADPLHFVLLHPEGTDGWHLKLSKKPGGRGTIPPLQFYAYHLQLRYTAGQIYNEHIFRATKLFHEYLCVSFARVENQRLKYIANHQEILRGESYKRVCEDVTAAQENNTNVRSGQQIILPPSYTGSPRYMHAHFQDGMAIVRENKKPDYFITFTMNPACPEVVGSLLPGQRPQDRPDIISRVFNQKFKSFMDEICKKHVLGRVKAFMWVIEWQKRGLPHAHILLILEDDDRIRTADQVDQVITAELPPDPESFTAGPKRIQAQKLQDAVLRNMIHTCSPICKTDGNKCKKFFPKPFSQNTEWEDTAFYPDYRRRRPDQGGRVVEHNGRLIDNRSVVPYNPYLLLRFDAHINIEICVSPSAAKYLFKYITKGGDRAMVATDDEFDEIKRYQNMRSIGPSEAAWRLYKFDITNRYPPVLAMRVHLPGEQYTIFEEGKESEVVAEGPKKTELIGFFNYNMKHPGTKQRYIDFPKYFTWQQKTGEWKQRKQGFMIGRIHTIHPLSGDEYYLRILLHHDHCKGATCYEDLRFVNGVICETFKEACAELGLLQHDGEWENALAEANATRNCSQLRSLFAVMLVFCEVSSPFTLYNNHRSEWIEDYQRKYQQATEQQLNILVLMDLDAKLQARGKTLASFGLPVICDRDVANINVLMQVNQAQQQSVVMQEEFSFDLLLTRQICDTRIALLQPSQRAVFDIVMHAVNVSQPLCLFIDARGGTGKTYVLNTILAATRTLGNVKSICLAVASSGIAATLLCQGRTLHSRFKIPIQSSEIMSFSIKPNDSSAEVIRQSKVIVWDEAPMTHRYLLEGLDRTLRDITQTDLPFGGKILILAGDFRQVLPVIPHGSRAQITDASLRKSDLWRHFTVKSLNENMRVGTDPSLKQFDDWLEQLGNGEIEVIEEPDFIQLPQAASVLHISDTDGESLTESMKQFVETIFSNIKDKLASPDAEWINWVSERAILAPKNIEVDKINKVIIDSFPGSSETLCSADSTVDSEESTKYPPEFLNSLTPAGMPPHELFLKVFMHLLKQAYHYLYLRKGSCSCYFVI